MAASLLTQGSLCLTHRYFQAQIAGAGVVHGCEGAGPFKKKKTAHT